MNTALTGRTFNVLYDCFNVDYKPTLPNRPSGRSATLRRLKNSPGSVTLLLSWWTKVRLSVTFNTTGVPPTSPATSNGRRITVTGHLASFTELYFDKRCKTKVLGACPSLTKAQVFDGGLGPAAKLRLRPAAGTEVEIDQAPEVAEIGF